MSPETAENLAIQGLSFLAADPDRLGRFLSETGLGPDQIRAAAAEPGFLAGVLSHLASNEQLAKDFAAEASCDPADLFKAHVALGGQPWEREVP